MKPGLSGFVGSRALFGDWTARGQTEVGKHFGFFLIPWHHPGAVNRIEQTENEVAALSGVLINPEIESVLNLGPFCSNPEGFGNLVGTLTGMYFDKATGVLMLHADRLNQLPFYYAQTNNAFVFAPSIDELSQILLSNGYELTPSSSAAACLLAMGSIPGAATLVEEIQQSKPGESITGDGKVLKSTDRNRFADHRHVHRTDRDAIDALQSAFSDSTAVMTGYNMRYGFEQYNLLSGGIDSRMVFFETRRHCPTINTLCFSQDNYLDARISSRIAGDFGARHRFHSLGSGTYLCNTSTSADYGGKINYLAGANHRDMLSRLNLSNVGLIASGQLGNEILSEFALPTGPPDAVFRSLIANPSFYSAALPFQEKLWSETPDTVVFKLLNRGLCYTNSAALSTHAFGFLFSPFADEAFLRVALGLSPDQMRHQRLYLDWMAACQPEATRYTWERYRVKPRSGPLLRAARIGMKVMQRFWYPRFAPALASMNPLDWWYDRSPELQRHFNETFTLLKPGLERYPIFSDQVLKSYERMSVFNKASVLTLLQSSATIFDLK